MTEHFEPLRIVAHRARLLAAGELDAQAKQEFLRIAQKLEAEASGEGPSTLVDELHPTARGVKGKKPKTTKRRAKNVSLEERVSPHA
jgi:hypothetical protein